jgi:hypothetical protein
MRTLKLIMGNIFAVTAVVCVWIFFRHTVHTIHRYHDFVPHRGYYVSAFFLVIAIIFGIAWWTVIKGKPLSRIWGGLASTIYIMASLWMILYSSGQVWGANGLALAIGVSGLAVFLFAGAPPTLTSAGGHGLNDDSKPH